jgi:hypothetical protein
LTSNHSWTIWFLKFVEGVLKIPTFLKVDVQKKWVAAVFDC